MSNIQVRDFSSYTDFLPLQFSDSDNLIKLLAIYLDQVEELNKAQQELSLLSTNISTATGYQLDIIGNLLGARREGRLDSEYRNYIRFRISINTGSGTPSDVINFVKSITSASKVRYWEHYPASVVVETNGNGIPTNLVDTVDNVTPAGVKAGAVLWVEDDYAVRPCRLSEAYLNYVEKPLYPVNDSECGEVSAESGGAFVECATAIPILGGLGMGEEEAYMGNPLFEMTGLAGSGEFEFSEVSPTTVFGQSVLPNITEVYSENYIGAGGTDAFSNDPDAIASGLIVTQNGVVRGTLATVLTDKNNN